MALDSGSRRATVITSFVFLGRRGMVDDDGGRLAIGALLDQ